MTLRKLTVVCISIALSIILIELLIRISDVKWSDVSARFLVLDYAAFLRLAALMAANMYISSQKWQLVDQVLRRPADRRLSEGASFTLTSLGVALGQVLPVQFASSMVRTMGTWAYGSPLRRGTLSTLVEQGSDLLMVCFLAIASAATLWLHGGAGMWLGCAFCIWVLVMLSVPGLLPVIRKLGLRVAATSTRARGWKTAMAGLCDSGLLNPRLGRQLLALSMVRFAVLVLMAGQTTAAIRCDLPLWRLAAAMPIAVLSSAIGITPGGLGFTEFGYSAMLTAYGTPLATATQWALANRLLTSAAAFLLAIVAVPLLITFKTSRARHSEVTRPACD